MIGALNHCLDDSPADLLLVCSVVPHLFIHHLSGPLVRLL